ITWAVFMNDGAQWHRQKWFVDMCAAMNCEYLLVDGGWRTEKWGFLSDGGDLWARLKELCQYGAAKNVDILVWNAYPEGRDDGPGLTDPEVRRAFFRQCKEAGVKGVKIDFFDSESRDMIGVYEAILRETAENQLMVSFHGANKPTGEARTWPHEITQEGLREQEYVLWDKLPLTHYGALPFSRMVAGHGDFLPGYVRHKYLKNTTAVFQMATAVIYTSPFICWPDHPEAYLESPFLSLVRTMPPVWDETLVLPGSTIGRFVAFARRSGRDWYVALLNCQDRQAHYELDLGFLGAGDYLAALYHDGSGSRFASRLEAGRTVKTGQRLSLDLEPGGGFVGKFNLPTQYTE
ncbi:MAG: glycoside hydrolase family 97 catalytic domain-containing protein, partial [Phycisphaerae bacterium]|nr:glycoside hydrolase family 97 catalytic domain-containing protein [Phycisphaerae bacterium]